MKIHTLALCGFVLDQPDILYFFDDTYLSMLYLPHMDALDQGGLLFQENCKWEKT